MLDSTEIVQQVKGHLKVKIKANLIKVMSMSNEENNFRSILNVFLCYVLCGLSFE